MEYSYWLSRYGMMWQSKVIQCQWWYSELDCQGCCRDIVSSLPLCLKFGHKNRVVCDSRVFNSNTELLNLFKKREESK